MEYHNMLPVGLKHYLDQLCPKISPDTYNEEWLLRVDTWSFPKREGSTKWNKTYWSWKCLAWLGFRNGYVRGSNKYLFPIGLWAKHVLLDLFGYVMPVLASRYLVKKSPKFYRGVPNDFTFNLHIRHEYVTISCYFQSIPPSLFLMVIYYNNVYVLNLKVTFLLWYFG